MEEQLQILLNAIQKEIFIRKFIVINLGNAVVQLDKLGFIFVKYVKIDTMSFD